MSFSLSLYFFLSKIDSSNMNDNMASAAAEEEEEAAHHIA